MAKGSFVGLYSFEEIAKIYQIDPSTLRKMVQYKRLEVGKEVKKFGKVWLITEEAVRNHLGNNIDIYLRDIKVAELQAMRELKMQRKIEKDIYSNKVAITKKDTDVMDLSCKDDDLGNVENMEYVEVDSKTVVSSFNFSS